MCFALECVFLSSRDFFTSVLWYGMVIARKNFIEEMVPKTIMYFLVNHVSRDTIQNELVAELYRDIELPSLMKEIDYVAQRRKTFAEMKDILSTDLEMVNEVRDFNTFR